MADAHRWIQTSYLGVAACVTVVRGLDLPGTVRAFGGDPSAPPRPLEPDLDGSLHLNVAAVGQVHDLVVVVEPNGYQGSRPEVLRRASAGGLAVSVFWNVNGRTDFRYAVHGEVVTELDLSSPEDADGSDPDRLLPLMADLPLELADDLVPAGLALAERITSQALSPDDLLGVTDVWPLVPLLEDLHPMPARYHGLSYHDPALVEALAGARPEVRRAVAAMAADRAVAATGLDREPGIAAALEQLRAAPGRPLPAEVAERVRHIRNDFSTFDPAAGPEAYWPAHAAGALHRATNADALTAALDALDSARLVLGDGVLDEARAICETSA